MIPHIVDNQKTITIYVNGQSHAFGKDHPSWAQVRDLLNTSDDPKDFLALCDTKKAVVSFSDGKVVYQDGEFYYNGEVLHSSLVSRIKDLMADGFPFEGMQKFLENLMENPSMRSREELYDFLQHKAMPITEDGHFLAYKAVRKNFRDIHSGKFLNAVGTVLEMPRKDVDDDRERECSYGFHVGHRDYAVNYGGRDSILLTVKVNPRDCVSVPRDHNAMKLRVCRYEVVSVNETKSPLDGSLYSESGEKLKANRVEYQSKSYLDMSWGELFDLTAQRGLDVHQWATREEMIDALKEDDSDLWDEDPWYDEDRDEDYDPESEYDY